MSPWWWLTKSDLQTFQESIFLQTSKVPPALRIQMQSLHFRRQKGPFWTWSFVCISCLYTVTTWEKYRPWTSNLTVCFVPTYLLSALGGIDFPDVKAFSSQQSAVIQNTADLQFLKTSLSAAGSLLMPDNLFPFPLQWLSPNQCWWPLQLSPWKWPHIVARARQVPEEKVCFESQRDAAAILLETNKKKKENNH